jgi:hypothetical protein
VDTASMRSDDTVQKSHDLIDGAIHAMPMRIVTLVMPYWRINLTHFPLISCSVYIESTWWNTER